MSEFKRTWMVFFFPPHLFQPCARDHLEEGQWRALPQQSEDEVLQRRAGDSQLPAGRHGRIRVRGREQDGQEHGHRTTGLLRYPDTLISRRLSNSRSVIVTQLDKTTAQFQRSSSSS